MTTNELQKELEARARSVKERANGQPWGDKEIKFYRVVYKYTQEHEKALNDRHIQALKFKSMHELANLYNQAFTMLSGCPDLPLRTDSPTPIGFLILMKVISLTPDCTEMTTLKRFVTNAFNPARFVPRTKYGTFGNYRPDVRLETHTYHDENQSKG